MADVTKPVKDALYVAVGLGVIGIQRAQVQRRELRKQLENQLDTTTGQLQRLTRQVEGVVDPMLDQLTARLPERSRGLVTQARSAAKEAQGQLLGRVAHGSRE